MADAVRDVAEVLGLDPTWLNSGPTALLDFGLPAGFADRTTTWLAGGIIAHQP